MTPGRWREVETIFHSTLRRNRTNEPRLSSKLAREPRLRARSNCYFRKVALGPVMTTPFAADLLADSTETVLTVLVYPHVSNIGDGYRESF